MSEEEIIEILSNLKEYIQNKIDSGEHKIYYNDLDWDVKCVDCISAIDTILDLYNKQEEEINKLKKEKMDLLNTIHKQQKEIEKFNNVLNEYVQDEDFNWKQISDYVEEYYISKYKIRDKIKELEELPNNQYIHLDYIKQEFKKLLEE